MVTPADKQMPLAYQSVVTRDGTQWYSFIMTNNTRVETNGIDGGQKAEVRFYNATTNAYLLKETTNQNNIFGKSTKNKTDVYIPVNFAANFPNTPVFVTLEFKSGAKKQNATSKATIFTTISKNIPSQTRDLIKHQWSQLLKTY